MDRGAWWATVHGVTKSQTRLSTRTPWLYNIQCLSISPHCLIFLPSWNSHSCWTVVRVLSVHPQGWATWFQARSPDPSMGAWLKGFWLSMLFLLKGTAHIGRIHQNLMDVQRPHRGPQMDVRGPTSSLPWYGTFCELCAVFWDEDKILRVVHASKIRVKNHLFTSRRGIYRRKSQGQDGRRR